MTIIDAIRPEQVPALGLEDGRAGHRVQATATSLPSEPKVIPPCTIG